MSITLDLPADLTREAQRIPDLEHRITLFLRQQVELEEWRNSRYSTEVRSLVEAASAEAEKLRRSGISRAALFDQFTEISENQEDAATPSAHLSDEEAMLRLLKIVADAGPKGVSVRDASMKAGVFYLRAASLMRRNINIRLSADRAELIL